jgi:MarR family transcriptional regulator, organic hydroperoxide resistance regulator
VPSAKFHEAGAGQPARTTAAPPPAGAPACAPLGPDGKPIAWGDWPGGLLKFPDDLPLHALMLSATRLLGAYGQHTVQAAGLNVSLAGLGVLRVLMASDGLKSTELAEQAWSSPGTMTSVVSTLVKGGFVERRPDAGDRRVVRLYITDEGRALISYYVPQAAARWRKAFDFVDEGDEAVIRGFFIQLIDHLSQLLREERGA